MSLNCRRYGRWVVGVAGVAAAAGLCLGAPSPLTVVINEIHYDPFDKTSPSEFVELCNSGTGTVDLSGCYFSAGIDYVFPASTALAADEYLVIAQDTNEFERVFGFFPSGQWLAGDRLQNDGETVRLLDAAGDAIDEVDYGLGFPWPTASQGEGSSMELINPAIDNDLGGAWRSSAGGPTPGAENSVYATVIPPCIRQVDHGKDVKAHGEAVTVTAKITDPDGVSGVDLMYQVVEPGDYINLDDPRYATEWTTVTMRDDGLDGDETAGDATYCVILPGSLQQHRRLIRYRIEARDAGNETVTVPYADDAQPNFAYFVYDAMPAWAGMVEPGVTTNVTYGTNLLQSIPVCQLITVRQDHLNAMHVPYRWGQPDQQVPTEGQYWEPEYKWQGTMVYDGRVYDHIHYRARGGVHRYKMGKNMWKFDFNRGRYLQAKDDYGRKYDTRWDKLNFSALIQQGNFLQRGEQGLFEAAGFRLHNLAGNAASKTHFLHFRVIEGADEIGPDQYSGDFQGLYLAVEQLDGNFLDEHALPDGNLYKMEGGSGELNNQGATHPADKSDLNAFMSGYGSSPNTVWWRSHVDLEDYYSFRAIAMAIHDYDMHAGKNYFYYHNPSNDLWRIFNWDIDLCWTTTYTGGGGQGPLYDDSPYVHLLDDPVLRVEYNNRMREIRDLLFNPEQTGMLLDEVAQVVYTPGELSLVEADRAMWDYNPLMISSYVNLSKASHGKYYEAVASRDFTGMVQHVKNYVATRVNAIDPKIPSDDSQAPDTPTIVYTGDTDYPVNHLTFETSAFSGGSGTFAGLMWRIAEVTVPGRPDFDPSKPRKYEITANWQSPVITGDVTTVEIPSANLKVGRRYRVRARMKDANQRWSHWSDPVEFVTSSPDNEAVLLDYLRVTEVMYNPPDGERYEYIEVCNTSAVCALDIEGVSFTSGIDFSFPQGAVLEPGAYAVVVSDAVSNDFALFRARYGLTNGEAVFGPYDDKLSNGGEEVTLKTASAGETIVSFEYDDGRGWPPAADGAGHSLVPVVPAGPGAVSFDYGRSWRACAFMGGSPAAPNPEPVRSVVINEFGAHTDTGLPPPNDSDDWVELYNPLGVPVDLGDWHLSDSADDLRKFRFPSNTVIEAGGFLCVSEMTDFHTNRTDGSGFGLDKAGEGLFLSCLPDDGTDRVADAVRFEGQENNASWGRYPDGEACWSTLMPTTNAPNALSGVGVVISEFVYHAAGAGETNHAQFIELHNAGSVNVPLWTVAGAWRISGIDYTFPSNLVITSGTYLAVVDFDPATNAAARLAFLSAYPFASPAARLLGPFDGDLSNGGERLALERPQEPDLPGDSISWVVMDEVIYSDGAPWPPGADGSGRSLARGGVTGSGNDPGSWYGAVDPTPGGVPRAVSLSYPPVDAVLFAPLPWPVTADVNADVVPGVSCVYFHVNGEAAYTATASPYTAPASLLGVEGTYELSAALIDSMGGIHTSRTFAVTVYGPPPDPGIHKLRIAFSGYPGSETLRNFPVPVRLGAHIDGFAYSQFASGDCYDLRFTDGTAERSLAYEVEEWNTNGESCVWVRLPALPPGGTEIHAFWGDPALSWLPPYTTDGTVWSEGFAAVWHLSGTFTDAVSKAFMIDHGSSDTTGVVSGGRALDGVAAYLEPAAGAAWYNGNQGGMTLTAWANGGEQARTLFGVDSGDSSLFVHTTSARVEKWVYHAEGASDVSAVRQVGAWDHIGMTFGMGLVTSYLNGDAVAAAQAFSPLALGDTPILGALKSGGPVSLFEGSVDELRLSTVTRSEDWLLAEYHSATAAGFATYQFLGTYGRDADGDALPDRWEIECFGATNAVFGGANEDWDGDRFSNYAEFVAGTDPMDGNDYFALAVSPGDGVCVLGYPTVVPGVEADGRERVYALQASTNRASFAWEYVNGHTNEPSTGGWNAYTSPVLERVFYRGEVRLR